MIEKPLDQMKREAALSEIDTAIVRAIAVGADVVSCLRRWLDAQRVTSVY